MHHLVDDRAHRFQAEEGRWFPGQANERPDADGVHTRVQRGRDEMGREEPGVTHEGVEGEGFARLSNVAVMVLDVGDEDLLEIEREQLRSLEAGALGEQLGDVLAADLASSLELDMRDAEVGQLPGVARPGVPADIVALPLEVHGDARQRVEVTIERHRREEELRHHVACFRLVTIRGCYYSETILLHYSQVVERVKRGIDR